MFSCNLFSCPLARVYHCFLCYHSLLKKKTVESRLKLILADKFKYYSWYQGMVTKPKNCNVSFI